MQNASQIIDVKEGFLHIPLDEKSSLMTIQIQMDPFTIWHQQCTGRILKPPGDCPRETQWYHNNCK